MISKTIAQAEYSSELYQRSLLIIYVISIIINTSIKGSPVSGVVWCSEPWQARGQGCHHTAVAGGSRYSGGMVGQQWGTVALLPALSTGLSVFWDLREQTADQHCHREEALLQTMQLQPERCLQTQAGPASLTACLDRIMATKEEAAWCSKEDKIICCQAASTAAITDRLNEWLMVILLFSSRVGCPPSKCREKFGCLPSKC